MRYLFSLVNTACTKAASVSVVFCIVMTFALVGCGQPILLDAPSPSPLATTHTAPVTSQSFSLTSGNECMNTFQAYTLDHTTTASQKIVSLYESNGSGVAINDLNNDGYLDIVLGNLNGPNTILWNEGALNFRTQRLAFSQTSDDSGDSSDGDSSSDTSSDSSTDTRGNSRAVNIVDVDGDGLLDIVVTRRFDKPFWWRNTGEEGDGRFVGSALPDVNNPLFTMDWGDVDQDGDLDLVAASYDTELRKQQGGIFEYRGGGVGVFVYARQDGTFLAQRLAEKADSLALSLVDLNGDQRLDILVGNDFDRPDYAWLRSGADPLDLAQPTSNWQVAQPFNATAENTMSFDAGDVNNDGVDEIFSTDMKPYSDDDETMAAWAPLMGMMAHAMEPGDPQIVENVLLFGAAEGAEGTEIRFENFGPQRAVNATGWSWSSKFGDLNQDGFLDIYVVNGMIASDFLEHLPGNELVEENQALRNDGLGNFVPAPEWGLGSIASGRGMSMGDLDNDGDLDIVVNNLASPAQLFENQICGGSSLQVELEWPESQNRYALGSRLSLHTSAGTYYRTVRAASGYLSGDPHRVHFGLPADAQIERLEIRWPDGKTSVVDEVEEETLVFVQRE